MNKVHEFPLTVPCVKAGDCCFPNFALPTDAEDIGFRGRRRKEFLREYSILFLDSFSGKI